MSSTSLSVVVPRRASATAATGDAIARFFEPTGFTFEILTPDGEDYGASLRRAVSEAKGRVVVVVDPELPYPVSAIGDVVAMIESGASDVVYGSTRAEYQGPLIPRCQPSP